MIGQRLAHFEITAKLGEGGMGEVYRARDGKLGRDVALKVVPAAVTGDPERMARFEREARLLASLNHPNIAGIYEVGGAPAVGAQGDPGAEARFLVMELVRGETLAERLARGPMRLEEVVPLALQIAAALEAAHAQGVIHRDLKPGNVMVADGQVKVLDFGLARALEGPGGTGRDLSLSPTLTARMTSAGTILGTAAYMSPEQAKGEEADRRSDIWSFGVVLWEMLTGRKTFEERTASETLAAVLKIDPDFDSLPRDLPSTLRRLLERCLRRDPRQRLHDIADARLELEAVAAGETGAPLPGSQAPAPGAVRRWRAVALTAGLAALVAAGGWYAAARGTNRPAEPTVRWRVADPAPAPGYYGLALSPNGRELVYPGSGADGVERLYLRTIDRVDAVPINGSEGGRRPFFSPAGDRLGFQDGDTLKIVTLGGGAPVPVFDLGNYRGASWGDADSIVVVPDTETGLWRISPSGEVIERLTVPDAARGERSHRDPVLLPGGEAALFTVATSEITSFDDARIDGIVLATGERRTVVERGMFPLFVAPDHLLFFRSGALLTVSLDPKTLAVGGAPAPVLDGVKTRPSTGLASAAVSADGSLAVGFGASDQPDGRLMLLSPDGGARPLVPELRPYQGVAVSPDGKLVALDVDAANAAIWLLDVERGIQTRLTLDWSHNRPIWSPDGREVLTDSSRGGVTGLYRFPVGGGPETKIWEAEALITATDWTADGRIVYGWAAPGGAADLWWLPLEDPSGAEPLVQAPGSQIDGVVSPDGRWLAYVSDESGAFEVYVLQLGDEGVKLRVSAEGGYFPVWRPDGGEIFFASEAGLMAVTVPPSGARVGRPSLRYARRPLVMQAGPTYDVLPDGSVVMLESSAAAAAPIDLIWTRNWVAELESRLAGGGR